MNYELATSSDGRLIEALECAKYAIENPDSNQSFAVMAIDHALNSATSSGEEFIRAVNGPQAASSDSKELIRQARAMSSHLFKMYRHTNGAVIINELIEALNSATSSERVSISRACAERAFDKLIDEVEVVESLCKDNNTDYKTDNCYKDMNEFESALEKGK
jgi:hypothetical protein